MNDETINLDQADEDILNPTISDEAIEAAAAIESQNNTRQVGTGNSTAANYQQATGIGSWNIQRFPNRRIEGGAAFQNRRTPHPGQHGHPAMPLPTNTVLF